MDSNRISTPHKPPQLESILSRLLKELLRGSKINRKSLGKKGIAASNSSLNSWISVLRNEKLIPIVSSDRKKDFTCDYSMMPDEIARHLGKDSRQQQRKEMRCQIETKRQKKFIQSTTKFLDRLNESPSLWKYLPNFPEQLDLIAKKINAILAKRKGVN